MSDWQPIETVPRDGSVVLLCQADRALSGYASSVREWKRICIGRCVGREWSNGTPGGHSTGGDESQYTHWMPLPALPQ